MTDAELSKKRAAAGRKGGKKSRKGGFAADPLRSKYANLKRWHPDWSDEKIYQKISETVKSMEPKRLRIRKK